jgi:hypothetical protein
LSENQSQPSFENHRSSSLDNHEGDTMRYSYGANPRNFRRQDRRILRERISTREVTVALSSALANVSTKEIADASGSSLRAAENAKGGVNAMCLAHFFNACQQIPELKAMAMSMMGVEPINPDRERAMALLVNSYVQQGRGA